MTTLEKELIEALRNLLDDLDDAEEDRNPETGEEYQSCARARKVLERAELAAKIAAAPDKQPRTPAGNLRKPAGDIACPCCKKKFQPPTPGGQQKLVRTCRDCNARWQFTARWYETNGASYWQVDYLPK